jgi:hypothetical protein
MPPLPFGASLISYGDYISILPSVSIAGSIDYEKKINMDFSPPK